MRGSDAVRGKFGILALPCFTANRIRSVDFCHQHNLVDPDAAGRNRNFGIRVTLPANDTLRKVLGNNWERVHWYATEAERDAAYENMAARHAYYRKSDNPSQVLEKISR